MPKEIISFAGLKALNLVECVQQVEQRSISTETLKQYESKLKTYTAFLSEIGEGLSILPINEQHVKQCFTFLVESKQVENIQYLKGLLAALRNYARFQRCPSVTLIDTEDPHSSFGRFWVGIQKTIPEHAPEPKKALAPDLLLSVIRHMERSQTPANLMVIFRDILMFVFAFLGVKRAGCVCKSSPEKMFVDMAERRIEVDIYKGKDTKKRGKRFYICLDQENFDLLNIYTTYTSFIQNLYAEGALTEDEFGKKFFITVNTKTLEWNDSRMTTPFFTRVLRERLKAYFAATNPSMSEAEIQNVLKKYESHSMRRGGTSTAKRNGASSDEVMELGGWNREQTKDHYLDSDIAGECQAYKKMKISSTAKFTGRNIFEK